MKSKIRELISQINIQHSNQLKEKMELADCPLKAMMCEAHLTSIYVSLLETEKYRTEKNYEKSVETLKNAFNKTNEIQNNPCTKCANHYHSNIIETMENLINEIYKTSNGMFRKKIHVPTYNKALKILKEMRNFENSNNHQLTESQGKFLGIYLN